MEVGWKDCLVVKRTYCLRSLPPPQLLQIHFPSLILTSAADNLLVAPIPSPLSPVDTQIFPPNFLTPHSLTLSQLPIPAEISWDASGHSVQPTGRLAVDLCLSAPPNPVLFGPSCGIDHFQQPPFCPTSGWIAQIFFPPMH